MLDHTISLLHIITNRPIARYSVSAKVGVLSRKARSVLETAQKFAKFTVSKQKQHSNFDEEIRFEAPKDESVVKRLGQMMNDEI